MPEMPHRHEVMHADIELALLTDPTPAGWVYVDLEGINPRILANIKDRDAFIAYFERLCAILRALYGEFRADPSISMRGMTFHINTAVFSDRQIAAARPALATRLAGCGCSDDDIEQLIGSSTVAETISEYAARVNGDDPVPAARIPKPRKRQPSPRPAIFESEGDD
ncbi:hypothetical protein [Sulfitobacter sp. 1A12057]|uniref:hypothetical protein n=1 Tax=Sulfitobacter sp. 1A12057 TaxID=3368567 RepID=UPI0037467074